jgi:hypothetical protein
MVLQPAQTGFNAVPAVLHPGDHQEAHDSDSEQNREAHASNLDLPGVRVQS